MQIYHLDFNYVARTVDFVKEQLVFAADHGYDTILWELENQVRWDTCPECATPDSWSKKDFKKLLDFSRSLGLKAIPLLQTIGHAEYVMKNKKYFHFREQKDFFDCYCTSDPDVREFLAQWIQEIRDLFGDLEYFHMGGDEAYRFGSCPVCSKRERNELYAEHISSLAAPMIKDGITPCIWGDMILAARKTMHSIPKTFAVWDWKYCTGFNRDGKEFESTDFLLSKGYKVVLCSAVRDYHDGMFTPTFDTHVPNVIGITKKYDEEKNIIGNCVTSWSIRMNPMTLSAPVFELPALMKKYPSGSFEKIIEKASMKYFGYAEGIADAGIIGRGMINMRIFTAIQAHAGLKDSAIPPKGYLKGEIARWGGSEQFPPWIEHEKNIADAKRFTREGLDRLAPYAKDHPSAKFFRRAARLQLEWLSLVDRTLKTRSPELKAKLLAFRDRLERFYRLEETPASARKNAVLVTCTLIDYLK